MNAAASVLANGSVAKAADLLSDLSPLYAVPIGLAVVFAIGYWIKGLMS